MLYSVVIPCYKSSESIRMVVESTAEELERLGRTPYEFVLVDDCSPDEGKTLAALKSLYEDHDYVKVIALARNGGQHNAIMAALNYAEGDAIIAMDDDGQTHPSQLHLLFDAFDEGHDIVYGYYPDKKHSPFRNFGSWVNYISVRILIGKPKDLKTSSFWIIKKFVRDYVIEYKSQYTHLQGLFLRTTKDIACVPVKHFDRVYGKSGYTFKSLVSLWSNIMGFSIVPLRIARNMGIVLSIAGLIGALVVFIRKLLVPTMAIGWASVMVSIWFFSGMIMIFLGLIGEYIGRMFLGMGHYPQYVVMEVLDKGKKEGAVALDK